MTFTRVIKKQSRKNFGTPSRRCGFQQLNWGSFIHRHLLLLSLNQMALQRSAPTKISRGTKTFEERWNFKSKSGRDFWIQLIYQGFGTPMIHWCSWCKSGGKISHWSLSLKCLFCNIESPELVNSWKPRSVLATLDEEVPFDATSVGPWLCMVLSSRADLISSTSMSWVKWFEMRLPLISVELTQKYIQNCWVFVVISSSTKNKGLRFVDQILHGDSEFHPARRTGNIGRCSQLACLGCSADPVTWNVASRNDRDRPGDVTWKR